MSMLGTILILGHPQVLKEKLETFFLSIWGLNRLAYKKERRALWLGVEK